MPIHITPDLILGGASCLRSDFIAHNRIALVISVSRHIGDFWCPHANIPYWCPVALPERPTPKEINDAIDTACVVYQACGSPKTLVHGYTPNDRAVLIAVGLAVAAVHRGEGAHVRPRAALWPVMRWCVRCDVGPLDFDIVLDRSDKSNQGGGGSMEKLCAAKL